MDLVFFDTETSGLSITSAKNGGDEVIQFSAIVFGSDFSIKRVINRYCKTNKFIDAEAQGVHKLSDRKIDVLSGGKFFEQIVEEEKLRDLTNITWIGYNIGFDKEIINQTLIQNGAVPLNFGRRRELINAELSGVYNVDVLMALSSIKGLGHRASLESVIKSLIGIEDFVKICKFFREKYGIIDPLVGEDYFHNAVFDSLAVALLVQKYRCNLFE